MLRVVLTTVLVFVLGLMGLESEHQVTLRARDLSDSRPDLEGPVLPRRHAPMTSRTCEAVPGLDVDEATDSETDIGKLRLRGRVVLDGVGVPGARVVVIATPYHRTTGDGRVHRVAEIHSGAAGRFAALLTWPSDHDAIDLDDWEIEVLAMKLGGGFACESMFDGFESDIELPLMDLGWVEGRVVDDQGHPLRSGELDYNSSTDDYGSVDLDSEGRFLVAMAAAQELQVTVNHPQLGRTSERHPGPRARHGSELGVIVMGRGRDITGHLVDPTGHSIEGLALTAVYTGEDDAPEARRVGRTFDTTVTNAQGRFRFSELRDGDFEIIADSDPSYLILGELTAGDEDRQLIVDDRRLLSVVVCDDEGRLRDDVSLALRPLGYSVHGGALAKQTLAAVSDRGRTVLLLPEAPSWPLLIQVHSHANAGWIVAERVLQGPTQETVEILLSRSVRVTLALEPGDSRSLALRTCAVRSKTSGDVLFRTQWDASEDIAALALPLPPGSYELELTWNRAGWQQDGPWLQDQRTAIEVPRSGRVEVPCQT
ncbi:MAG: carboxypeptidase regulatory-like domain-containing protein, partial [Planctomycetes bacterium]|nr:carboxypeptidase regulatory-like domain-containing protein [Planctomycetota bacterium]